VTRYWNNTVRFLLPLVALAAIAFGGPRAHAAPTLDVPPGSDMASAYHTGQAVSLHLRYTDPNGDPIKKSDAIFTDESSAGAVPHNATDIDGTDTSKGVTISWDINGFVPGPHKGHFQVTAATGSVARYPAEASTYYSFGVEEPYVKWIELLVGILVCLVGLPLITYLVFRSVNPRGDPSRSARGALFLGVLAVCGLFIYLFTGIIGLPLLIGISVIAVILGLVVMFGRR